VVALSLKEAVRDRKKPEVVHNHLATLYSAKTTLPVSVKGRPGPTFEGWDFTKRDRQERAGNQKGTNVESKFKYPPPIQN